MAAERAHQVGLLAEPKRLQTPPRETKTPSTPAHTCIYATQIRTQHICVHTSKYTTHICLHAHTKPPYPQTYTHTQPALEEKDCSLREKHTSKAGLNGLKTPPFSGSLSLHIRDPACSVLPHRLSERQRQAARQPPSCICYRTSPPQWLRSQSLAEDTGRR